MYTRTYSRNRGGLHVVRVRQLQLERAHEERAQPVAGHHDAHHGAAVAREPPGTCELVGK